MNNQKEGNQDKNVIQKGKIYEIFVYTGTYT